MKIDVVQLKQPCSACHIIVGLVQEILNKLSTKYDDVELSYIKLDNFKNLHEINGLEIERFPAIIINGEQITAGSLPDKRYLQYRIELELDIHE